MTTRTSIAFLLASLLSLGAAVAYAGDAKPLAKCRDGKTMTSTTGDHRGACGGHGGVAAWLDGSPPPKSHTKVTSYK